MRADILESHEKMIDGDKVHRKRVEGTIHLAMSSSVCSRYFKDDFLRFRGTVSGGSSDRFRKWYRKYV